MGAVNVRRKSHSELTNCCLQSGGGIAIPSWTTLWFSPRQSSQAVKTDFSTKNTALKTITCSFYHYPPLEPASRLSARLNFFFFFSFLSSLFTWLISCFLFSYFSFITALPKKKNPSTFIKGVARDRAERNRNWNDLTGHVESNSNTVRFAAVGHTKLWFWDKDDWIGVCSM